MMRNENRAAIKLAIEILAQPEFSDLRPLSRFDNQDLSQQLIKCNAGSFILPDHICYGNHADNPRCTDCARRK